MLLLLPPFPPHGISTTAVPSPLPHLLSPPPPAHTAPRHNSRDYILSCCDEAARRREALRGAPPRAALMGRPRLTDHSWERMFFDHLHWKRWTQERMGPYHSPI